MINTAMVMVNCGCTDFCMNLHYFQHGNDSNDYTFTLPETTTVDEEELEIDIYEVGFRIGALNNDGTVTYTHTDETTQVNVLRRSRQYRYRKYV